MNVKPNRLEKHMANKIHFDVNNKLIFNDSF